MREQASRGCPSARGCIALAPAPRRTPPCPSSRPQLMALAGSARMPPGYAQIGYKPACAIPRARRLLII